MTVPRSAKSYEDEIALLRQQLAKPVVEPLIEALRNISYKADINGDYYARDLADEAIAAYDALEK
jgi:hypothetical protein